MKKLFPIIFSKANNLCPLLCISSFTSLCDVVVGNGSFADNVDTMRILQQRQEELLVAMEELVQPSNIGCVSPQLNLGYLDRLEHTDSSVCYKRTRSVVVITSKGPQVELFVATVELANASGGRVLSIDDSGGHRQETSRRTRGDPRIFKYLIVRRRVHKISPLHPWRILSPCPQELVASTQQEVNVATHGSSHAGGSTLKRSSS